VERIRSRIGRHRRAPSAEAATQVIGCLFARVQRAINEHGLIIAFLARSSCSRMPWLLFSSAIPRRGSQLRRSLLRIDRIEEDPCT